MTIMSTGPFASIRRNIHHRRNVSNNSAFSASSSGNISGVTEVMVEQQRSRYEEQKKEAKEIWAATQSTIKNDWEWPNASDTIGRIDTTKDYAERSMTLPDESIQDLATINGLKRKREVRTATFEEMQWNDGLRVYEQRRKAWTGAVDVFLPPGNSTEHSKVVLMQENPQEMLAALEKGHDEHSDDSSADGAVESSGNPDPTTNDQGTTLLPYYMPILPKTFSLTQPLPNVVAERALYRNLVMEGKTAVAPIPLANVIQACVTGLKEADAWPPKAGAIDPLAGKVNREKRRSRIKSLLGIKKGDEMEGIADFCSSPDVIAVEAGFES